MPTNIESRIVSMTFDNAQFEKGVATSRKTLDELDKQLQFKDADKSFQNLTDAAGKVSFSKVVTSADDMAAKIKASTVVGVEVLRRLTDAAIDFGKTVANKITKPLDAAFNQIKTGGWARATNIDQAKFKLSGLGVAWEEISEDINYGVSDTAYGLDEAATAAANLLSAGVEFGNEFGETGNSPMAKALRGISGLAGMFNRSYDDLAGLYQVVAAAGGVTNDALSRFRERGIPVAAQLAKYFNTTEDAIKDMAKNGEISFEQFADAMDTAFGEHAKDANSTFEGAMSNMKSALSRIGAEFAEDYRREMVPVFNALRTTFNAIKKQMDPIFEVAEAFMADLSDRFVKYVDAFNRYIIDSGALKSVFEGVANLAEAAYNILGAIVDTIINAFRIITPDLSGLDDTFGRFSYVMDLAKKDTFKKPADAFKRMSESVLEITQSEGFLEKVVRVTDIVFTGVKNIFKIIKNLFSSAFTVGRILVKAVTSVFQIVSHIISKFTGKQQGVFGGLFSGLANGTEKLSEWLKRLEEWINENKIFDKVVETTTKAIDKLAGWIGTAVRKVKEIAGAIDDWVKKMTGLSIGEHFDRIKDAVIGFFLGLPSSVRTAWDTLKKWYEVVKGWVTTAIDWIKDIAQKIDDFVKQATGYSIGEHFNNIKEDVVTATEKVKEFFKTFGKSKEADEATEKLSPFAKVWSTIKYIFSNIVEFIKGVWPIISDFFVQVGTGLGDAFKELGGALKNVGFEDLKDVLTGGGAVAGGTGVFLIGTSIKKFVDTIKATFTGKHSLVDSVKSFFSVIKGSFKDTMVAVQKDVKADMVLKIAKAVAILAASIFALSLLKPEKVIVAVGAIEAVFLALKGIMTKMGKIGNKIGENVQFIRLAFSMLFIAGAVSILSGALFKLSLLNPGQLIQGVIALSAVIDMFDTLLKRIGKLLKKNDAAAILSVAGAVALMAFAIKLLVKPIKTFGKMKTDVLIQGVLTISYLLKRMAKTFKKMKDVSEYAHQGGKAISAMAFALMILVVPIKALGRMKFNELVKGIMGVSILLMSMALAIRLMSKNTSILEKDGEKSKETSQNLKGVAITVLALAAAIRLLTPALEAFSDDKRINLAGIGKMLLAIAGLAAVLGLLNRFGGHKEGEVAVSLIKMSVAFIAMALAMKLLVGPLKELNDVDVGSVIKFLVIMAGMAAVGAVLGPVLQGLGIMMLGFAAMLIGISVAMQMGAVGITMLAGAFALFLPVLKGFEEVSWGTIGKAFAILGGLALVLGGLGLLFSGKLFKSLQPKDLIKIATSMLILAGALSLVTKVLSTITDIPWPTLGKAGIVLAGIVAALAILAFLPLDGLGDSLLKISLSILIVVGVVIVLGAVLGVLAVKFRDTLEQGLQALTELMPAFFGWFDAFVSNLLGSLIKALPQVFELVTVALNGLLQLLIDVGPKLVEVLEGFIPYVLQGILVALIAIASYAYPITLALVDILVNVLIGVFDGLSNRMEEIMNSMWHFIETLVVKFFEGLWEECKKLWDWLKNEAGPWLKNRAPELLQEFWDGIVQGLKDLKDTIVGWGKSFWNWLTGGGDEAVAEMESVGEDAGNAAKDALNNSLGVHSPSKETEATAGYYADGFVQGLAARYSDFEAAGGDAGSASLTGLENSLTGEGGIADVMKNAFSGFGGEEGEGLGLELPITPVLDMDGNSDTKSFMSLLGGGGKTGLGLDLFSKTTVDNSEAIVAQETNNHLTEQTLTELQGMREDNAEEAASAQERADNLSNMIFLMKTELTDKLASLESAANQNATSTNAKITSIRNDLSILATSVNNMKVVLDTGAIAGDITPKIDVRLGREAAYRGRGIK